MKKMDKKIKNYQPEKTEAYKESQEYHKKRSYELLKNRLANLCKLQVKSGNGTV